MSEEVIGKIHALDHLPVDELNRALPAAIEELRAFGAGRLLKTHPHALAVIITALLAAGAAEVFTNNPAVADALMDALWDGVEARAGDIPDLTAALNKVDREIQVNIEASDSPLAGHFHITKTGITGGAGLVHFRDQDYRYMGPTEIMLQLLLGELSKGTSNLHLQTAGHSGFASRVGPVLKGITALIKG